MLVGIYAKCEGWNCPQAIARDVRLLRLLGSRIFGIRWQYKITYLYRCQTLILLVSCALVDPLLGGVELQLTNLKGS